MPASSRYESTLGTSKFIGKECYAGMKETIRNIFEQNTDLIRVLDRAVLYYRRQEYDKALTVTANSVAKMKDTVGAVISDGEYFNLVSTDQVLDMLSGILEAQKKKDFLLLCDLLEFQMISFLCGVQELIISKEEILFDEDRYNDNVRLLKEKDIGQGIEDLGVISPDELVRSGYRVEFTSCGLMTLAAENNGSQFYFHTNGRVCQEAMWLAEHWYSKGLKRYLVFGLGMGYHIIELAELAPEAEIEVYESDINVLKLACAFSDLSGVLSRDRVKLHFDPEYKALSKQLAKMTDEEAIRIHYPSYQNIRDGKGRKLLESFIPWTKTIESC